MVVGAPQVHALEKLAKVTDEVFEAIALLVGVMGCKLAMPSGMVGPTVLSEMNLLLNPVAVVVRHDVGVKHPARVQDVLVFENVRKEQRDLLEGLVFP